MIASPRLSVAPKCGRSLLVVPSRSRPPFIGWALENHPVQLVHRCRSCLLSVEGAQELLDVRDIPIRPSCLHLLPAHELVVSNAPCRVRSRLSFSGTGTPPPSSSLSLSLAPRANLGHCDWLRYVALWSPSRSPASHGSPDSTRQALERVQLRHLLFTRSRLAHIARHCRLPARLMRSSQRSSRGSLPWHLKWRLFAVSTTTARARLTAGTAKCRSPSPRSSTIAPLPTGLA